MITYSTQRIVDDQKIKTMIVKSVCRQSMSDKLTAMNGNELQGAKR